MTKVNNYPKVCFGCSRPHIKNSKDEVLSKDGEKSFSVLCVEETDEINEDSVEGIETPAESPVLVKSSLYDSVSKFLRYKKEVV